MPLNFTGTPSQTDPNQPQPNAPTAPAPGQPGAPAPSAPSAPPPQSPAQADAVHHTMLGKAASFLFGGRTDYQVDPETGKTVPVPVQEKPGQLMRSLVAGALLGGAMGSGGNFIQGLTRGGAAGQEQAQQQDAQRRQQAQQQFENQQKVQREKREQSTADAENEARKAMTAHENQETTRTAFLLHKEQSDELLSEAERGKGTASLYIGAGMVPLNKAPVPASEMTEYLKKHPEMQGYKGIATGSTTVFDKDGTPHTDLTYDFYPRPDSKTIKITPAYIETIKKQDPELAKQLQPGQQRSFEEISAITLKAQTTWNDAYAQQDKIAKLKDLQSQAAERAATTAHTKLESEALKRAGADEKDADEGIQAYRDKKPVSPAQQLAVSKRASVMLEEKRKAIDELRRVDEEQEPGSAAKDPEMKELVRDYYDWLRLGSLTPTAPGNIGLPKPPAPGAAITDDARAAYLKANGGNIEAAKKAATADGWGPPAGPEKSAFETGAEYIGGKIAGKAKTLAAPLINAADKAIDRATQ